MAPGLPGPEALEVEWSSSSSEESPVYATKPVFNLFTAGSERRDASKDRKRTFGDREGEKYGEVENTHKKKTTAAAICFE